MAPAIEQLAARGYPIRKVNVTREPGLAAQFHVSSIPCFVMVVNGREADRVVGSTNAARLEQMFALAERRGADPRVATQLAAGPSPGTSPRSIPAVQSGATFSASDPAALVSVSAAQAQGHSIRARQLTGVDGAGVTEDPEKLQARLLAASVRLRIKDAQGQSCGSGTIIDARKGQALILTCGHLFRDSHGKGPIEVDLFGPAPAERLPGELIHYDLTRDVALVIVKLPGPVTVARLAPHGFQVAKGAKVIHVGCNNGAAPTARTGHVTDVNRFAGPANVEVSGIPVQGRSGGGLFTAEGKLIGVCNAAIADDNEGLYAALGAIQSELESVFDTRQLAFVYDQAPPGAGADSGLAPAGPPTMPKSMAPPADLLRLTEAPPQPLAEAAATGSLPRMTPQEAAVWDEIQRRKGEGAEVICIIRPRNRAAGKSDVLVVDQASPAFLDQLAATNLRSVPVAAAGAPATRQGARPDGSGSDWQPRWLQPGYQGE
jgi:S1-C subfamily serine protease